MKSLLSILTLLCLSGCVTQKKVESWLDEHPLVEAERCVEKFPVRVISEKVTIRIDSGRFKQQLDSSLSLINQISNYLLPDMTGTEPTVIDTSGGNWIVPEYEDPNVKKMINRLAQLEKLIKNFAPIIIDTSRQITVKDSAETVIARIYKDSTTFYKGQFFVAKSDSEKWHKKYNHIWIYIVIFVSLIITTYVLYTKSTVIRKIIPKIWS